MLSWSEARAYCREFHTDLVSVTNSEDNNVLAKVASQSTICYWIGLYRDTWKWSDGTKISNLQWAPTQPDNLYKNENCGAHYTLLEDESCTTQHFFVCHTSKSTRLKTVQFLSLCLSLRGRKNMRFVQILYNISFQTFFATRDIFKC